MKTPSSALISSGRVYCSFKFYFSILCGLSVSRNSMDNRTCVYCWFVLAINHNTLFGSGRLRNIYFTIDILQNEWSEIFPHILLQNFGC